MQIQIPRKFLTVLWQETSLLNSITKQIKVNFIISTVPHSTIFHYSFLFTFLNGFEPQRNSKTGVIREKLNNPIKFDTARKDWYKILFILSDFCDNFSSGSAHILFPVACIIVQSSFIDYLPAAALSIS